MGNEKDLLPLDGIAEDLQHTAKAAATHIIILRQDRKSLQTTVDQLQAETEDYALLKQHYPKIVEVLLREIKENPDLSKP